MTTSPLGAPVESLRERAIRAARERQNNLARDLLHQVVELDPYDEIALLWLAHVSPYHGEQVEALQRALAINPSHPHTANHLVLIRDQPGAYAPAEHSYRARRRRRPAGLTLLAVFFLLMGLLLGGVGLLQQLVVEEAGGLRFALPQASGTTALDTYVLGLFSTMLLLAFLGGLGILFGRSWGWLALVLLLSWWCMALGSLLAVTLADIGMTITAREAMELAPRYLGAFVVGVALLAFLWRDAVAAYVRISRAFRGWAVLLSLLLGFGLAMTPLVMGFLGAA